MKPLYVNYKGVAPQGDATMRSVNEVDSVLDGIKEWLGNTGALLMLVGFVDGDSENGPLLQVGINRDKGLLTYDGPDNPEGLLSHGGGRSRDLVYYFFQGTKAEFPASAEVPYERVKQAVKEFGSGDGALPGSINWRPDTDD